MDENEQEVKKENESDSKNEKRQKLISFLIVIIGVVLAIIVVYTGLKGDHERRLHTDEGSVYQIPPHKYKAFLKDHERKDR